VNLAHWYADGVAVGAVVGAWVSPTLVGAEVGAAVGVGILVGGEVSFEKNAKSRYADDEGTGTLAVFKLHCSLVGEHSYDPQAASLLQ
jgi:hypothetical protein